MNFLPLTSFARPRRARHIASAISYIARTRTVRDSTAEKISGAFNGVSLGKSTYFNLLLPTVQAG
jgi:hypothetical protein